MLNDAIALGRTIFLTIKGGGRGKRVHLPPFTFFVALPTPSFHGKFSTPFPLERVHLPSSLNLVSLSQLKVPGLQACVDGRQQSSPHCATAPQENEVCYSPDGAQGFCLGEGDWFLVDLGLRKFMHLIFVLFTSVYI